MSPYDHPNMFQNQDLDGPNTFEQLAPPPPIGRRSTLGEIWSQLKAGAFVDLPRMAGQAMKYVSNPGNTMYESGQGLVESAEAINNLPEMQPSAASDNTITGTLAKGARMIPQSIAPAVGAGLLLSGVGAPAGVALIGGSALAAAPAGLAQAQETYEKGLAKHGLTPEQASAMPDDPRVTEARNAGYMTGAIEWGGETAGGALAGRFMGIGGNVARNTIGRMLNKGELPAAQTVLQSFTTPGAVGRFAANALETAAGETLTEMGQGAGEAAVEQHYGYDQTTPWQAATDAIAPTLGMSALLLPFGIPAHASHATKINAITSALQNPATAPELRSQAAEIIYNELAQTAPDAATNFAAHAYDAIHGEQETGSAPYGMTLDDSVLYPLTPRAFQEEQSEPAGVLSRAVAAGGLQTAVNTPQPGMEHGGTDLLGDSTPAITATIQPQQPAGIDNAIQQHINNATSIIPEQPEATASLAQTPLIPADSLHGVLQRFIRRGQEETGKSGQGLHVWEAPNKGYLDKAVDTFLQPAAEQGLVLRDSAGSYHVNTDGGALRIMPPSEAAANYRVEYHDTPAAQPSGINTPDSQTGSQFEQPALATRPDQGNAPADGAAPVTAYETVTTAFPGQSITPQPDSFHVAPKNGNNVKTISAGGINTPDAQTGSQFEQPAFATRPDQGNAPADGAAPVITYETVTTAFPGQSITPQPNGFHVALKNGNNIKITSTGEITLDRPAAETGYGRVITPTEKPVAAFQTLDHDAVITLTEQGAGEIHHETFHAAMHLALNKKQRDAILKKFGTEEAAAAEYQQLRDSGALTKQRRHHMYLQALHDFFQRIRTIFNPSHGIMQDIASGQIWDAPAAETPFAVVKYSLKEINAKTAAVSDRLAATANKSTFVRQDIAPAMKATGEGIAAAWDGIKAAVNPMDRSVAAEEAGRILIEGMGRMEHGKEKFINELNKSTTQTGYATIRLEKALDLMQTSTTLADKLFTRMPEVERLDFMQRMDTGQHQATKELQQVADAIKTMFNDKAKAVQALGTGALENVRENYFPHIWDRSTDAAKEINTRLSKRPLEGSKAFSKDRVFDDINSGLEAGFTLVDTNPINLVFLKMSEMDKYINAHVALQAMEQSGLVQLIPAGEKMPDGFGDISGKYGLVTKRAHQDAATGMPGGQKSYRYIAREDVAQVFNNYLSQNLYTNKYIGKPFSVYMKAANMLNQFQLGVFSAFHAGFTSLEAVISHAALGIKALTRGDFQEAGKYFKHAPVAWYLNPKLGNQVIKAWMGDKAAAKEMPQIIQWLEMAGARRIMDSRFQTDQTQKMFQAWNAGNKTGAAVRTIPAIVEQSARPILEWLVPRQKFGVFAEMANEWSQRHPGASHEATRKAMQQIWNRVDSRLGQVVYDRMFIHNVAKNLTQAIIRAPGWTGGTILEVGGGFKDLVTYAKELAIKGKQAELSDRAAYTLSLVTVTAISNAVLTALFTGEPPKDWKDLIAFRTGRKDEKGNPERFMLPTYAKDLYAYAQKPGTTLLHKAHPMLSLIGDLVRNQDYYGTEIRHQGDNPVVQLMQAGKFTAKAFIPFWMKGVAKEMERGGSIASMAAPLIGIMPAPANLNQTAAERLASELVQARMPKGSKTQEQFEKSQLIQHLTGLARRDPAEARAEIQKALNDRKITMLQARHVFKNSRLAPIQIAFKRLSYEEAQRVYEVATEEEQKKLRYLMRMKKRNHLKAGNETTADAH